VDLTPEMVAKAQAGARLAGVGHAGFRVGAADRLPVRPASVDVVVTNGVFNLCVDKAAVLAEVARVLVPGGRLQMADILLEPHVTESELAAKGEWSD
jgi:ubiquinone/menaquinone biosynthesis C-methylase UbiE